MKTMRAVVLLLSALLFGASARGISIVTVPIGNPGNPPDLRYVDEHHLNGIGSVAYRFRMGRTEVTNAQYVAFLNAVAATDTYQLYSTAMGGAPRGGIVRSGSPGSYNYAIKPPVVISSGPSAATTYTYDDKPVVYVTWADAARFTNWLHNGQPIGGQDASSTEDGAYTLNGAMTNAGLAGVSRNATASWWIPSEDEWYKAAYHRNDGFTNNYWDYPTGTDTLPDNSRPTADTGNSANFRNNIFGSVATMTDAGAYVLSHSPYGTFDQGGNVFEWNDTELPSIFGPSRVVRGGGWYTEVNDLHARRWQSFSPVGIEGSFDKGIGGTGFRVATIPEPSASWATALVLVALLSYRTRPIEIV